MPGIITRKKRSLNRRIKEFRRFSFFVVRSGELCNSHLGNIFLFWGEAETRGTSHIEARFVKPACFCFLLMMKFSLEETDSGRLMHVRYCRVEGWRSGEYALSPAPPHQTVRSVCPNTAFRLPSSRSFRTLSPRRLGRYFVYA